MNKLVILLALISSFQLKGQELNCQVSIVTDIKQEVSSTEIEIINQLEQTIFELMNNTQWTKDKFNVEERINCQLLLQIKDIPSSGSYTGSLQIQSSRPVFNSSYNTLLFNFQDEDIQFSYSRNAVLVYAPNQFRDNLTSILAFYAYFIIGMDYDSYALKGGAAYFNEAQQIVSNAQATSAAGWKSSESSKKNRYWLVDNVLHQLFEPLRECNYEYHRLGLDVLYNSKEEGRKAIHDGINKLNKVVSTRPNSINLLNFVQAKQIEIRNLFADADQKDKVEMVNILKRIDPANASKYEEILN
jgi:hypothetical protein